MAHMGSGGHMLGGTQHGERGSNVGGIQGEQGSNVGGGGGGHTGGAGGTWGAVGGYALHVRHIYLKLPALS